MKAHSSRMSGIRMSVKGFLRRVFSFLLLLPIYFYRICISPLTPPSCRFTPTCSAYAVEAIKKHGPIKGFYLAVRRIYGVTLGVVPAMILYLKLQNVENGKEYK